jgi:hypothetical protein
MDWIEQLLGVSPDGGNGMLELVYYAVLAFGVGMLVRWRLGKRGRSSGKESGRDQGA